MGQSDGTELKVPLLSLIMGHILIKDHDGAVSIGRNQHENVAIP
jgi:hypothetical protein